MSLPQRLTYADVAKLKQVSTRTVMRWVATGRLRALRVGRVVRFAVSDVDAMGTDTDWRPAAAPAAPQMLA